ncbi:MAG: hypothetical protein SVC26_09435 [Pseudomonadota bacterium]|nr:hypothetical protein [Pseudomonadota bacterium]
MTHHILKIDKLLSSLSTKHWRLGYKHASKPMVITGGIVDTEESSTKGQHRLKCSTHHAWGRNGVCSDARLMVAAPVLAELCLMLMDFVKTQDVEHVFNAGVAIGERRSSKKEDPFFDIHKFVTHGTNDIKADI